MSTAWYRATMAAAERREPDLEGDLMWIGAKCRRWKPEKTVLLAADASGYPVAGQWWWGAAAACGHDVARWSGRLGQAITTQEAETLAIAVAARAAQEHWNLHGGDYIAVRTDSKAAVSILCAPTATCSAALSVLNDLMHAHNVYISVQWLRSRQQAFTLPSILHREADRLAQATRRRDSLPPGDLV